MGLPPPTLSFFGINTMTVTVTDPDLRSLIFLNQFGNHFVGIIERGVPQAFVRARAPSATLGSVHLLRVFLCIFYISKRESNTYQNGLGIQTRTPLSWYPAYDYSTKSRSRFDPHPQRLPIFHLILGGRSESLLRKPGFPYQGTESPGNCSGSSFCPDQVLLSKNFHSRPACRQKSLLRNSGVGSGGQNLILIKPSCKFLRFPAMRPPKNCIF